MRKSAFQIVTAIAKTAGNIAAAAASGDGFVFSQTVHGTKSDGASGG